VAGRGGIGAVLGAKRVKAVVVAGARKTEVADSALLKALLEENMRKIETWTARHSVAIADWPATPVDPFFNVNTPADAAEAERIAKQQCDL